jgi:1-pyrroline-5-carboxylate dehydrogenase
LSSEERRFYGRKIVSINPANKNEVIGRVSKADKKLAEEAMQASITYF